MVGISRLKLLCLLKISLHSHESLRVLRCRGQSLNIMKIEGVISVALSVLNFFFYELTFYAGKSYSFFLLNITNAKA